MGKVCGLDARCPSSFRASSWPDLEQPRGRCPGAGNLAEAGFVIGPFNIGVIVAGAGTGTLLGYPVRRQEGGGFLSGGEAFVNGAAEVRDIGLALVPGIENGARRSARSNCVELLLRHLDTVAESLAPAQPLQRLRPLASKTLPNFPASFERQQAVSSDSARTSDLLEFAPIDCLQADSTS